MNEARNALLSRLQDDTGRHQEAHQALHDSMLNQMSDLGSATHTKLEAMETSLAAECKQIRSDTNADMQELASAQAASHEGFQQKHKTVVRHAQALTKEMTQLAEAYQNLDQARQEQQQELQQVHRRIEDSQRAQQGTSEELAEQITALQHSATVANGCALVTTLERRTFVSNTTSGAAALLLPQCR